MAFNFYGTYTTGQFNELRNFARKQLPDLNERIAYLEHRRNAVGVFQAEFDPQTKMPLKYSCNPPNSYGNKLLRAFRAMGGVPERTFILRVEPVYMLKSTPIKTGTSNPPKEYSNGRIQRINKNDGARGVQVVRLKSFMLGPIKHKLEHLEYKIKRTLDYSDSLTEEINFLKSMIDSTQEDFDFNNIETLLDKCDIDKNVSSNYNIIRNDTDIFGYRIGNIQDVNTSYNPDEAAAFGERGPTNSGLDPDKDDIFSDS
jgi:hypothetical protein